MADQQLLNDYFTFRCRKGLWQRGLIDRKEYIAQLEYEIDVILEMGFPGYFLLIADILDWCREQKIPIGPGRGSSGGSLAIYCLNITQLDPIRYHLIFERFLNPKRVSMPDIDLDFCELRRHEIIEHLVQQFGEECVSGIGTFGKMKAKGAIRDVSRALGSSYEAGDYLSKLVLPPIAGKEQTLATCYEKVPELMLAREGVIGREYQEILEYAEKFEGRIRVFGQHASGFIVSNSPIKAMVPLARNKTGGLPISQFDMRDVEDVGPIKFDFLALRALTTIDRCLKLVKQRQDIELDPLQFPVDDLETYKLLSTGDTVGIFQLEGSSGIQDLTTKIQPKCLEDLSLVCAIYRPGPLASGMVDQIIQVRNGMQEPSYLIPELEPILKETAGVIVYQEEAMQISRDIAGYSLAESDIMRKAIGKKIDSLMAEQEIKFIEGAVAKGLDKEKVNQLWENIKAFSDYSFCAAHSTHYAYISFQTAYLKTHYPAEFICSCLISDSNEPEKVYRYISYCRRRGIPILPPDINESQAIFNIDKEGQIRFGLGVVKHVGKKVMEGVVREREKGGLFKDIFDFCERAGSGIVDKLVLRSLVLAGAFDSLPGIIDRSSTLDAIEDIWRYRTEQKNFVPKMETYRKRIAAYEEREIERTSGSKKNSLKQPVPPAEPKKPEMIRSLQSISEMELLKNEVELTGYYITGHPVALVHSSSLDKCISITEAKRNAVNVDRVSVVAVPILIKETTTRKTKEKMAYLTIEDGEDIMEVIVFAKSWAKHKDKIKSRLPLVMKLNLEVISGEQNEENEGDFIVVKGKLAAASPAKLSLNQQENSAIEDFVLPINLLQEFTKKTKKFFTSSEEGTPIDFWIELNGELSVLLPILRTTNMSLVHRTFLTLKGKEEKQQSRRRKV